MGGFEGRVSIWDARQDSGDWETLANNASRHDERATAAGW